MHRRLRGAVVRPAPRCRRVIRALTPLAVTVTVLVLRGWQLSQRSFYWDDLVIPSRFRDTGLWVPYDGHLMPGSAAVQIFADAVAPLQWWLPAIITVAATALAAFLWWRLLGHVLGHVTDQRLLQTIAFTAIMFSPFLGAASGWWSAGVNALAWQIAAAGVGLIILSAPARAGFYTTATRSLAASTVLFAGLFMTEKALSVVPAMVMVALVLRAGGRRFSLLVYSLPAVLTGGWVVLYLSLVDRTPDAFSPGLDGVTTALGSSVLPGVLGGPWSWDRWNPSPAFSTTPGVVQLVAALVVAGLVAAYLVHLRSRIVVGVAALAGSAGYLVVILLLLREGRTGEGSTDLLARGMHYYADWWAVTVLLLVAAVAGARRHTSVHTGRRVSHPVVAGVLCLLFIASSSVSTVTWVSAWSGDETDDYLAGVRRAVNDAETSGIPLPEQNTPLEVLTPLMSPYNTVGVVAGRLHDSDSISAVTTNPRVVTPDGRIADAAVLDIARSTPGDSPDCGVRVEAGQPQIIRVDPALPFGDWTWEFTATADQPVTVRLSTPNGLEDESQWRARTVAVEVGTDLVTRWVNLSGGGGTILAEIDGPPGSHVCVGAGAVGPLLAR